MLAVAPYRCRRLLRSRGLLRVGASALLVLLAASGCRVVSHGQNAEGVRAFQTGQYQVALRSFEQSIATDPKNPDGYYNLASTYHRLAKLNNRPEDWKLAEDTYNRCLDHDPNHRACHRALAVMLVEENRNDQAQRLLEGWAQRNPSSPDPKIELARLSQEFGKPDQAREQLLEAVQVAPNDPRALTALGRLNEDTGNPSQALANYERALAMNNFQPELQARVNTLRTALNPRPVTTAPGVPGQPGTYTASQGTLPQPGMFGQPGATAPPGTTRTVVTPNYSPRY